MSCASLQRFICRSRRVDHWPTQLPKTTVFLLSGDIARGVGSVAAAGGYAGQADRQIGGQKDGPERCGPVVGLSIECVTLCFTQECGVEDGGKPLCCDLAPALEPRPVDAFGDVGL